MNTLAKDLIVYIARRIGNGVDCMSWARTSTLYRNVLLGDDELWKDMCVMEWGWTGVECGERRTGLKLYASLRSGYEVPWVSGLRHVKEGSMVICERHSNYSLIIYWSRKPFGHNSCCGFQDRTFCIAFLPLDFLSKDLRIYRKVHASWECNSCSNWPGRGRLPTHHRT